MRLIINADDFGLTKGTNNAIIELAYLNTISSTTVMVNMPYADDVKLLKSFDNFGVGLHFNLTQGIPVSSKKDVPSLVDKNGNFYDIYEFKERVKRNLINKNDVIKELTSQHDRLADLLGKKISHIDSHQDINKINLINNAIITYVKQKKIKLGLRWYNKSYLLRFGNSYRILNPSFINIPTFGWKRSLTETYFRAYRNRLKKSFVLPTSMLFAHDNSTRSLLKLIISGIPLLYQNNTYEIMCHPASDTSGLNDFEKPNYRIEEYEILKSHGFREYVKINKLVSFNELF